jgi:hypothetical protein
MTERHVEVFRYKSIIDPNDLAKQTSDQYVEIQARNKQRMITSFLDAIKETAVDCKLNATHNIFTGDVKCFQFEEPSLFAKQIGPAYKKDIMDDINMNTGSNALQSVTVKIRVVKISAVILRGQDTYSDPKLYWYYAESGVVYDYELYYPIGKVARDEHKNPVKLDKDTYVIDKLVPIPLI